MENEPVIKWTGSKKSQVDEILKYIPLNINTYYEPFIGGGSIMYKVLTQRNVKSFICSDINLDLIELWNLIKYEPNKLIEHYDLLWYELFSIKNIEEKKNFYYEIRERFNKYKDIKDFFFLIRTSVNGIIRYNSKKEFNTSFHFSRDGITPKNVKKIIYNWSNKIKKVTFICQDYKNIITNNNDFIYLDPPYYHTTSQYYGKIDYIEFFNWVRTLKCSYLLSFDGKSNSINNTYMVPHDIYDTHIYNKGRRSMIRQLSNHNNLEYIQESLYIKNCSKQVKFG